AGVNSTAGTNSYGSKTPLTTSPIAGLSTGFATGIGTGKGLTTELCGIILCFGCGAAKDTVVLIAMNPPKPRIMITAITSFAGSFSNLILILVKGPSEADETECSA